MYVSARRAKELEREAKEKEFADGQHPNIINGIWHCSNCGCPEDIAIGRRKGPLGDKSQCGMCGKFWHRHRRPRPVTYSSDPAFHLKLKDETDRSKTTSKRKRGPAKETVEDAPTPAAQLETPSKGRARANSAASTSSSASESPLARRVRAHSSREKEDKDASAAPHSSGGRTTTPGAGGNADDEGNSAPDGAENKHSPPAWFVPAAAALKKEYPDDKFELVPRNGRAGAREWRIKCLDCPGKLYKANKEGEQNMNNFEVHLKNRVHRKQVNERLASSGGSNGKTS